MAQLYALLRKIPPWQDRAEGRCVPPIRGLVFKCESCEGPARMAYVTCCEVEKRCSDHSVARCTAFSTSCTAICATVAKRSADNRLASSKIAPTSSSAGKSRRATSSIADGKVMVRRPR